MLLLLQTFVIFSLFFLLFFYLHYFLWSYFLFFKHVSFFIQIFSLYIYFSLVLFLGVIMIIIIILISSSFFSVHILLFFGLIFFFFSKDLFPSILLFFSHPFSSFSPSSSVFFPSRHQLNPSFLLSAFTVFRGICQVGRGISHHAPLPYQKVEGHR